MKKTESSPTLQDIIEAEKIMSAADVPTRGRMLHDGDKVIGVTCPECGKPCKPQGIGAHRRIHQKRSKYG